MIHPRSADRFASADMNRSLDGWYQRVADHACTHEAVGSLDQTLPLRHVVTNAHSLPDFLVAVEIMFKQCRQALCVATVEHFLEMRRAFPAH